MRNPFIPLLTGLLLLSGLFTQAQVERRVVIEHFTNTRCGICAFRNPDLFDILPAYPEVIHLAIHPSSPYSSCIFNQHNRSDNDARTNYYGIYGGTPRLVVMGEVMSGGVNFGDTTLITDAMGQQSPFRLKVKEIRQGTDSVTVAVTLIRTDNTDEISGLMYVVYAEDTIFYSAPNGESEHYNVLRETVSGEEGTPIAFPSLGDSVTWQATIAQRTEWDMDRMFAIAMVQNAATKAIWQAATTESVEEANTTSISSPSTSLLSVYPNPARGVVRFEGATAEVSLYTMSGARVAVAGAQEGVLSLEGVAAGLYILRHGEESQLVQVAK